MSIPAGLMVERFGEKKLMLLAFVISLIGSLVFAKFPSFSVFVFSLFTIGTGMAILQVVINPLLRITGGEENYAFTSVIAQLVFGIASFASPQVYSWLVVGIQENDPSTAIQFISSITPEGMSWISMYWVFALLSLLMVALIFVTKFPKVELNEDEKAGSKSTYLELFKNKYVILYFFGIFSYVGAEQGISYWMSKFLNETHGFDYQTVGADAVAYFWLLMTVGGVVGLVLLKVLDSKVVLKIFTIAAIISFAMALFGSAQVSLYSFMFSGFFLAVMFPIIFSLALNSVKENHGSFAGILVTAIMGGAVVQLIVGFISDAVSLQVGMAFVFIPLAYILSLAFWSKPIISNKTVKIKDLFKN